MTNLVFIEDTSEVKDPEFAVVKWRIADIKELKPEWSNDQCIEFLERIEGNLTDRMIERGWDVIESLINQC